MIFQNGYWRHRMDRPNKVEYFMSLALLAAQRASCPRRKVGCVLVDANSHVVSTGYNGPPSGTPNCTDEPCGGQNQPSGKGLNMCKAVHAEINAYDQAGDRLVTVTDMFLTAGPCCPLCTRATEILIREGSLRNLKRMYYFDHYPTDTAKVFEAYGIELIHVDQGLDINSMLYKLALLLGFRQREIPKRLNQALCVGGVLHGRIVTFDGDYMRAEVAKCTPEELDNMFSLSLATPLDAINSEIHEYYREAYKGIGKFHVMRYSKLDSDEFSKLFHTLQKHEPRGFFQ